MKNLPCLLVAVWICSSLVVACMLPVSALYESAESGLSQPAECPKSVKPPFPQLVETGVPRLFGATAEEVRTPLFPARHARLLFGGDVMQHMPQVTAARRADGTFDYSTSFAALKPLFAQADLVAVNLETTLTDSADYSGYPRFRSPRALAGALRDAGVDVCVLANNHCCDGGARGIRTTLAELDRCGIARTGVFADSADFRAHHPLRLETNGIHIALLNYTYGTNGLAIPTGMIVNRIDTARMAQDLRTARDGQTDCVVVCIHWGEEYERRENPAQRRLAAFLQAHGADVIVGSHPHVVQPLRADSAVVVFYSLGNLVSNQRKRYCDGGVVAEVRMTWRPDRPVVYEATAIPVWVQLPAYRILSPAAADTTRMSVVERGHYDRFVADTRETMCF